MQIIRGFWRRRAIQIYLLHYMTYNVAMAGRRHHLNFGRLSGRDNQTTWLAKRDDCVFCLTTHDFKMPQPICMMIARLQLLFVEKTSINFIFINLTTHGTTWRKPTSGFAYHNGTKISCNLFVSLPSLTSQHIHILEFLKFKIVSIFGRFWEFGTKSQKTIAEDN